MVNKLIFQDRDDCNVSASIKDQYSTDNKVKGLANLCPDNLDEVLFSIFCQHTLI